MTLRYPWPLVFFHRQHTVHLSKSSIQPSVSKDTQIRGSHVHPLCTGGRGQSDPKHSFVYKQIPHPFVLLTLPQTTTLFDLWI